MYQPRHVLCSASFTSPVSFLKDSGLSRFRGSDYCSGQKSVQMTNRAALFEQSIQCSSSTVMGMMLSMNPSINSSVAVMYTAKGSAVAIRIVDCCLSSCFSKYLCGKFRASVSQDLPWSRFFLDLLPLN